MRKKNKFSKRDKLKQELIEKYGISDEDFKKLNEENDPLIIGIIIILFAIAGLYAILGMINL